MTRRYRSRAGPTPGMLDLWMGELKDEDPPRRSLVRRFLLALAGVAGAVAGVVIAKYSPDILPILVALLAAGVVLRIVGRRLARSSLISPGSLAIIAFGAAVLAYAIMAPDIDFSVLARYVPRPIVNLFR